MLIKYIIRISINLLIKVDMFLYIEPEISLIEHMRINNADFNNFYKQWSMAISWDAQCSVKIIKDVNVLRQNIVYPT